MQVIVSGSLAIDRIMTFNGRFGDHIVPERIHQINLSFTVDGFNAYFGGTAGNIAYSLAMLGQGPRIVAAIGSDYRDYFTWFADNGIPTDDIRIVSEEATASAFIVTDLADNQITGFNPGAMKHATGFDFGKLDPADAINIVGPGNLTDMTDFTADAYRARHLHHIRSRSIPSSVGCRWAHHMHRQLAPADRQRLRNGPHFGEDRA